MDTFQGCYKDGTNGTRDCRYFAALYLITRFIFSVVHAFTVDVLFYAVGQFLLILFAMLTAIIQPYKSHFGVYNIVDTVFILVLALWYCGVLCFNLSALKDHRYKFTSMLISTVVAVLPLFYITAITLHWVCTQTTIGHSVICKIQDCTQYQLLELQNVNDEDFLPHRLSSPEHYINSLEDSVAASITDSSSCSSNDSSDEN